MQQKYFILFQKNKIEFLLYFFYTGYKLKKKKKNREERSFCWSKAMGLALGQENLIILFLNSIKDLLI